MGRTDGQGTGSTLPVMLVGGTEDENVPIDNNQLAFDQLINASVVYMADVIGANHTHFANVCAIGDLMLELGFPKDAWSALGAKDLVEPYEVTCSADAFPIDQATRLQNLYLVSFFKRHLLTQKGYDRYLTPGYADSESAATLSRR